MGSLTQTLPPIVPRLRICTSAIVAATSARIGRATSTSDDAISWVFVTIAPISRLLWSAENEIVRSSARSARSTSTSGEAARAFITLTSVWPPARARAPSCSERREIASSTVAGRAYSTSRRSMPLLVAHQAVTCQGGTDSVASRDGDLRCGVRRLGDQLAGRSGASGARRLERVRARAQRRRRRLHPHVDRSDAARLHPRGARVLASALHRLRRLRRARRASSTARGVVYVNTDLPTGTAFPDGSAAFITGSLEGNVAEFDRLAPGDGAAWERQFNEFMAQRRSLVRDPLDRALVGRRAHARPQGAPPARPPRPARVRRQHARQLPRLGHDDVRVGGRPRRPRAVGAPHRPRARSGDVRLHDAGDRRRAAARRHAGAGRRRRAARRRARGHRHRRRWRGAALEPTSGRSSSRTGARPASGSRDGEVVAATRAVVANVTPTQLYGSLLGGSDVPRAVRRGGGAVPLRARRDADPPRARRAAALEGRRGRAARPLSDRPRHAGSRRRLARGQRGGARAAAGRGDDRLRPAGRARPVARAGRQVDHLDPAAGAARRAGSRAMRPASSTPATAAGPTSCARHTPTGSSPGSASRSRTSPRRR